jgi:uncharacterized membrane protein
MVETIMQSYSLHTGVLSTLFSLCVIFWERDLVDLNPWALSVTSVIGSILVLILLSVSFQPTSSIPPSFKVTNYALLCIVTHYAKNKGRTLKGKVELRTVCSKSHALLRSLPLYTTLVS